jgi:hypothetical protein
MRPFTTSCMITVRLPPPDPHQGAVRKKTPINGLSGQRNKSIISPVRIANPNVAGLRPTPARADAVIVPAAMPEVTFVIAVAVMESTMSAVMEPTVSAVMKGAAVIATAGTAAVIGTTGAAAVIGATGAAAVTPTTAGAAVTATTAITVTPAAVAATLTPAAATVAATTTTTTTTTTATVTPALLGEPRRGDKQASCDCRDEKEFA